MINDLQTSNNQLKADTKWILKGKWSVVIHNHTIQYNELVRFGGPKGGRIRVVLNRITEKGKWGRPSQPPNESSTSGTPAAATADVRIEAALSSLA